MDPPNKHHRVVPQQQTSGNIVIQLVASVTSVVEEGTIDVPTSGVSKAVLKARIERLEKLICVATVLLLYAIFMK